MRCMSLWLRRNEGSALTPGAKVPPLPPEWALVGPMKCPL